MKKTLKYLIITVFACLVVALVVLGINYSNALKIIHDYEIRVFSLSEENCENSEMKDVLLDALRREHSTSLMNSPQLLVGNLAWIDENKGTHYLDMIVGTSEDENYFEKAKEILEEDKEARKKAVCVVESYLNEEYLYAVTPEYFDYLTTTTKVNDETIEEPND